MFRQVVARSATQAARAAAAAVPRAAVAAPTRRFLSTAPPTLKRRTWKGLVARMGLAGAVVYYYQTNDLFAEEPAGEFYLDRGDLRRTNGLADMFFVIGQCNRDR